MIRTAIILSSIILFVTWYVHVVNLTLHGAGFRRERMLKDVAYTATVSGALFIVLMTWALVGTYAWHVRGQPVRIISVLGPPFVVWSLFTLSAFAIGVALAELYCLADTHAFRRESQRFLAHAADHAVAGQHVHYARVRWWPATMERLVSDEEVTIPVSDETPGVAIPASFVLRDDRRTITPHH